MNQAEIIRMAKEAGLFVDQTTILKLEHFAAMVAQKVTQQFNDSEFLKSKDGKRKKDP